MHKIIFCRGMMLTFFAFTLSYLHAQQTSPENKLLKQEYNLVPRHSKDTQYYKMESKLLKHALDGTLQGWDIYRLELRLVPAATSSRNDEYTCMQFTVETNTSAKVSIPSLAGWSYLFSLEDTANKKGEMFGIEHSKFEKLTDENGKMVPMENTFHVYNAFIDFHTMSVFAEKTPAGKGIQHLKHIGDKIVHVASFSKPTVNLGTQVGKDSYFKNGKITLELKGLSLVNERTCAILEYDSGESSFYMTLTLMANMEVATKGSSHYWGDIYKDLTTGWIQKANLHELVISETIVPGMNKINSIIDRSINIKNGVN